MELYVLNEASVMIELNDVIEVVLATDLWRSSELLYGSDLIKLNEVYSTTDLCSQNEMALAIDM